MAKWASRFALGLSSSIHGITLAQENIEIISDISQRLTLPVSFDFLTFDH
jgi:hypothetical protein